MRGGYPRRDRGHFQKIEGTRGAALSVSEVVEEATQNAAGALLEPDRPLTSAAIGHDAAGDTPRGATAAACPATPLGDFSAFFHAHRDATHRFLWRLTRNAADADDLLQETFLVVWRKRGQFAGRGSVEGWLRRTAFRLYLNQLAKSRRRAAHDDARGAPVAVVAPAADAAVDERDAKAFLLARIEEAVDELPDEPRAAFVLFRFEGMTCAQIAEATDTPVKTVETRVKRATELLAAKVKQYRENWPGR